MHICILSHVTFYSFQKANNSYQKDLASFKAGSSTNQQSGGFPAEFSKNAKGTIQIFCVTSVRVQTTIKYFY